MISKYYMFFLLIIVFSTTFTMKRHFGKLDFLKNRICFLFINKNKKINVRIFRTSAICQSFESDMAMLSLMDMAAEDEDEERDKEICNLKNRDSKCYTTECPYFKKNMQKCKKEIECGNKCLGLCMINSCSVNNKLIKTNYEEFELETKYSKHEICDLLDSASKCYSEKCHYYKENERERKKFVLLYSGSIMLFFGWIPTLMLIGLLRDLIAS